MPPDKQQSQALADRLVSYADALVALAFVGASGLGLTLADPDIRPDIASVAGWIIMSNLVTGVLMSALIMLFRRWEQELRSGMEADPTVRKYSRYLHWGRIGVVWLAVGQALALLRAAQ